VITVFTIIYLLAVLSFCYFPFDAEQINLPLIIIFAEQISITPVFVKAELILMCCFFAIVTIYHAFNFVFHIL